MYVKSIILHETGTYFVCFDDICFRYCLMFANKIEKLYKVHKKMFFHLFIYSLFWVWYDLFIANLFDSKPHKFNHGVSKFYVVAYQAKGIKIIISIEANPLWSRICILVGNSHCDWKNDDWERWSIRFWSRKNRSRKNLVPKKWSTKMVVFEDGCCQVTSS